MIMVDSWASTTWLIGFVGLQGLVGSCGVSAA